MAAANHNRTDLLASSRGFTLVELLVSFMIIAALAAMGMMYMADVRKRSADAVAISEGRSLINAISQSFLQNDNADLNHLDPSGGNAIGSPAIYTLPNKVKAYITHTPTDPANGIYGNFILVSVWHTEGTTGTSLEDSRREFTYRINEETGDFEMPPW